MLATRVGYAGGRRAHPTYHDVGDHVEAVEATFDPRRVSYEELLEEYWSSCPTWLPPGPGRVRTAVFPRDEAQRAAAERTKRERRRRTGEPVAVEVVPGADFWPAERLHQKFHLQRTRGDLVEELAGSQSGVDAFLATTAAARLNAYVSGFGDEADLEEAAQELGWDVDELRQRLNETAAAP